MPITIKRDKTIPAAQVEALYLDAGWHAYTNDMSVLMQAIENSLDVVAAWDGDELVGLIRTVGDDFTVLYIQDILVLKAYRNQGIASRLLQQILHDYPDVRQKVLLTEDDPGVRHFYEKNGFQSCDKGNLVAFATFD
ncbi:GNAT family N-acetyltransferase [Salisediminibacterium beveridgei]|uniref:Acetyltransferase, GNAT family n=1 Tax=Salisediminibacterium beveridgei TaxID=632773 RepID=A0A1D7QZP5_9BACI|nr:GNAT family N-acetyltransferase [Salisediminibacterium beveridgei]AOM84478.1 acetyltransferase, GNAT family [Salisediminibacterium beveridgei]